MTSAAVSPGTLVRRSNLMVPVTAERLVQAIWRRGADAITLDIGEGVPASRRDEARNLVERSLLSAARGGAEVFVRVAKPYLEADLDASVRFGLHGIMLPEVESPQDVAGAASLLEALERRRGLDVGTTQLILLIESATGVWRVRQILGASGRVSQAVLMEAKLCVDLDVYASEECDPHEYARGRMIVEAIASGVQPVGAAYPLGAMPRILPPDELRELAAKSRNLGFKGVLCPHPSWVAPVNEAFTPTDDEVSYHTEVRRVFAEGVAAGTAAVPFLGRMIDVPVDERARDVLELATACRLRDEEKRTAVERSGAD